jgi:NAD/NADP transhydrogenase beta subunit
MFRLLNTTRIKITERAVKVIQKIILNTSMVGEIVAKSIRIHSLPEGISIYCSVTGSYFLIAGKSAIIDTLLKIQKAMITLTKLNAEPTIIEILEDLNQEFLKKY